MQVDYTYQLHYKDHAKLSNEIQGKYMSMLESKLGSFMIKEL